jgi:hypothetical protein
MPTAIVDQAGKGLQRQLMISTPDYCNKYEEIFGRKKFRRKNVSKNKQRKHTIPVVELLLRPGSGWS